MTDKLYQILNKPRFIKNEIRRINERIEDVRIMMLPSAIRYDTDKVVSSPSDPMLKFAERLDELETERDKKLNDYVIARDVLLQHVDRLDDDRQKDVIQSRFMNEHKFYQVAEVLGYSESQTYRIYADAIDNLEMMIVNESK